MAEMGLSLFVANRRTSHCTYGVICESSVDDAVGREDVEVALVPDIAGSRMPL